MSDLYQVVAECAHVTVDTPHGRMKTLVLKDAVVPGDAPEIPHLRDSGMVVPFGTEPEVDPDEAPRSTENASTGEQGGTADGETSKAGGTDSTPPPPPLSGPGSGREAWAAYASIRGVEVPDGANRDAIVAALKAANVPTERAE